MFDVVGKRPLGEYVVDAASGCWVWQRGRSTDGYGMTPDAPRRYAHRVYYELFKGSIPEGLHIDHLCRNRACVNPEHLEAVTPRVNSHRSGKTRLTASEVEAIRLAVANGASSKEVAARYGVAATYISAICTGRRWGSVTSGLMLKTPVRWRRKTALITAEIQEEIRALRAAGTRNDEVARRFGISESYASQIATGALGGRNDSDL